MLFRSEGFYYKPRVDLELLEKYHEGIIALSACLAGEVANKMVKSVWNITRNSTRTALMNEAENLVPKPIMIWWTVW